MLNLKNREIPRNPSSTERFIHLCTAGRFNWHIIDTSHSVQGSAMIYSLVETTNANNLKNYEMYEYLNYLMTGTPNHMEDVNLTL